MQKTQADHLIKTFCQVRTNYLIHLMLEMTMLYETLDGYLKSDDINFPPSKEEYIAFIEKLKTEHLSHKQTAKKKLDSKESDEEKVIQSLINPKRRKFTTDKLLQIFENWGQEIKSSEIGNKDQSMNFLVTGHSMILVYRSLSVCANHERITEVIRKFEFVVNVYISKANKFLGYWTAQMEDRKKKLKGPWAGNKAKRQRNIQILVSMISEYGGLASIEDKKMKRDLRLKAASIINVTDRAILDYLQEIRGKKGDKKV